MDKGINTLVFDLDDTLYSKADIFFQTFKKHGHTSLTSHELYQLYSHHSDIAFELFSSGDITLQESHIKRVQDTFQTLQQPLSLEKVQEFLTDYHYFLNHVTLSDKWQQTLDALQKKGYTLALLTNGPSQHQRNKIKSLQLEKWFSKKHWFISEELGIAKPNPKVFEQVRIALQKQQQECVMIGDSLTNDIIPAQQAGWHTIYYQEFNPSAAMTTISTQTAHSPLEILKMF